VECSIQPIDTYCLPLIHFVTLNKCYLLFICSRVCSSHSAYRYILFTSYSFCYSKYYVIVADIVIFLMIYYWCSNFFDDILLVLKKISTKNIIENNTCMCKSSKHRYKGIRDNSHQNLILLKLKLDCQPNRIIKISNLSTLRLSYSMLKLVKLS
jgi:hypothetical protein